MFSTYWPRPDKGKGKKRAAGVPAASVATAVGLGGEEGGAPPAKRPNSSLLEEAVYAMDALAGNPRVNAQNMELHNECVAWRATSCVFARECSFAMTYSLVTCGPCQASSSSCSLNRRTYTPARLR